MFVPRGCFEFSGFGWGKNQPVKRKPEAQTDDAGLGVFGYLVFGQDLQVNLSCRFFCWWEMTVFIRTGYNGKREWKFVDFFFGGNLEIRAMPGIFRHFGGDRS